MVKDIQINKDQNFINLLVNDLENGNSNTPWELFKMAYDIEKSMINSSFTGLKSLEYLPHMNFLPHQIETAERTIEHMNGRVLLADEVGLGKTIEAGLILKEYLVRGLVKKILILVPASLVNQWIKELQEKFFIQAIPYRKNYRWEDHDIIITSLDTAKREPHREAILNLQYDFVLVDEAHKLKNDKTLNYKFVYAIKKKYCLLLTATPIQNRLIEIFNLVTILRPGLLGNYETFTEQFGNDREVLRKDTYLKQLIQKIMIRNTRIETSLHHVERNIQTVWLDFSREELTVYEMLAGFTDDLPSFTKITLLRELCSSREACYLSLEKIRKENLNNELKKISQLIEQLPQHIKAEAVLKLIKEIGDEKVIIFTEYRGTQYYLQWYLQQHGISSVLFSGRFSKSKKDWMKQLFENQVQVLIATEAGAEGINLQFCHHLINYDLPWNPMKLEQRIGRIHRFGQENNVHIYNLAIKNTIEEHVMTLLYEKINLFEQVIGDLDQILAELNLSNIEKEIERIYAKSSSHGEAKIKLNNLSSAIQYIQQSNINKDVSHENI